MQQGKTAGNSLNMTKIRQRLNTSQGIYVETQTSWEKETPGDTNQASRQGDTGLEQHQTKQNNRTLIQGTQTGRKHGPINQIQSRIK